MIVTMVIIIVMVVKRAMMVKRAVMVKGDQAKDDNAGKADDGHDKSLHVQ